MKTKGALEMKRLAIIISFTAFVLSCSPKISLVVEQEQGVKNDYRVEWNWYCGIPALSEYESSFPILISKLKEQNNYWNDNSPAKYRITVRPIFTDATVSVAGADHEAIAVLDAILSDPSNDSVLARWSYHFSTVEKTPFKLGTMLNLCRSTLNNGIATIYRDMGKGLIKPGTSKSFWIGFGKMEDVDMPMHLIGYSHYKAHQHESEEANLDLYYFWFWHGLSSINRKQYEEKLGSILIGLENKEKISKIAPFRRALIHSKNQFEPYTDINIGQDILLKFTY